MSTDSYNDAMISGIVLSAGESSRFGSPKALALINGQPAITFLIEKLLQTRLSEIIVVLGADSVKIQTHVFKHKLIHIVYNNDYKFGQSSSVKAGLKALSPNTEKFMLIPIDGPFIKAETIDQLITIFEREQPKILIPTFENHRGHPPIFNITFKEQIQKLGHSLGINHILKNNAQLIKTIELKDPGITDSFNTPEEFATIKKTYNFT